MFRQIQIYLKGNNVAIPSDFILSLKYINPKEVAESFVEESRPTGGRIWAAGNEVPPVELFCYLGARFGQPNGIQNLLRADSSNNLIHWEWVLQCEWGWVGFQGMNYRTEIHLMGNCPFGKSDRTPFLEQLKKDVSDHSITISKFRKEFLEKWVEFSNPYFRLRHSIDKLSEELNALSLDPGSNAVSNPKSSSDMGRFQAEWSSVADRYSKGLGLSFGIRAMLPVLGESFINLLLFVLAKDEIKKDKRLRENATRQPIDVRIKMLHLNCNGFKVPVDFSNSVCGEYNRLINNRNDTLHGNIDPEKLKIGDVFFLGTVPVFKEYRTMWERSFGTDIESVGLEKVIHEIKAVDDFIGYVLTCLDTEICERIRIIMRTRDLGLNRDTGRFGMLFSGILPDMQFAGVTEDGTKIDLLEND
jgi:hypothetical protein